MEESSFTLVASQDLYVIGFVHSLTPSLSDWFFLLPRHKTNFQTICLNIHTNDPMASFKLHDILYSYYLSEHNNRIILIEMSDTFVLGRKFSGGMK